MANVIAKAPGFFIIIAILFLFFISFKLQILKPVDLNYRDPHMEELCSSKKVSSITDISDQLKCISYDINKNVISARKIIKNMIP